MRRLLRWTFHALAAASFLLCMATAALWVRSYWVGDQFYANRLEEPEVGREHARVAHYLCIASCFRGQCQASFGWFGWGVQAEGQQISSFEVGVRHPEAEYFTVVRMPDFWFGIRRDHGYWYYCRAPHWSLVSAFAVLPAIFVFRQLRAVRRRRRRARLGCCPACGYDLRATPERCPECGRES